MPAQVMVGGEIALPAATSEPDMRPFDKLRACFRAHPAPQHKGCCHQHHCKYNRSHSGLVNVILELERDSLAFSASEDACHKNDLLFAAHPLYLRIVSSERVAPLRAGELFRCAPQSPDAVRWAAQFNQAKRLTISPLNYPQFFKPV